MRIIETIFDVFVTGPILVIGYVVGGLSAFVVHLGEYVYQVADQGYDDATKFLKGKARR